MRDQVYRDHHPEIAEFAFDEKVASVFGDMLKRSVPGYGTLLSMLSVFAKKYAQPNTSIYDLGCSHGAATFAMSKNVEDRTVLFEGYDVSAPMIRNARELHQNLGSDSRVSFTQENIVDLTFKPSSIVVLNLTLQFLNEDDRAPLLKKIYDALVPGGILILAEKTSDTTEGALFTEIYYDFKRANGYNDLEIHQKRTALEKFLITDSVDTHIERLSSVGFSRTEQWFQTLIFRAFISWK